MMLGRLYNVLCMNATVNCRFLIYILNIKFLHINSKVFTTSQYYSHELDGTFIHKINLFKLAIPPYNLKLSNNPLLS